MKYLPVLFNERRAIEKQRDDTNFANNSSRLSLFVNAITYDEGANDIRGISA
jgi:hypothetical protein